MTEQRSREAIVKELGDRMRLADEAYTTYARHPYSTPLDPAGAQRVFRETVMQGFVPILTTELGQTRLGTVPYAPGPAAPPQRTLDNVPPTVAPTAIHIGNDPAPIAQVPTRSHPGLGPDHLDDAAGRLGCTLCTPGPAAAAAQTLPQQPGAGGGASLDLRMRPDGIGRVDPPPQPLFGNLRVHLDGVEQKPTGGRAAEPPKPPAKAPGLLKVRVYGIGKHAPILREPAWRFQWMPDPPHWAGLVTPGRFEELERQLKPLGIQVRYETEPAE